MTVLDFLYSIIGVYTYGETWDWPWIISGLFLLLITWGVIIILRSVISRV